MCYLVVDLLCNSVTKATRTILKTACMQRVVKLHLYGQHLLSGGYSNLLEQIL